MFLLVTLFFSSLFYFILFGEQKRFHEFNRDLKKKKKGQWSLVGMKPMADMDQDHV
jgi:hypothetical protein